MSSFQYRGEGPAPRLVTVERQGDGWRVIVDGRPHQVEGRLHDGGRLELTIDGARNSAHVAGVGTARWVAIEGRIWRLERIDGAAKKRGGSVASSGHDVLEATMPGQVRAVLVKAGDEVSDGQPLVLLEAMKMELHVRAPHAGRIAAVLVEVGQVVERGQRLVDVEAVATG